MRANCSTYHPRRLTIEVLVDHLETLTTEWHTHNKEAHAERQISFEEPDLALVGIIGRAEGPWAHGNKVVRTIAEREINQEGTCLSLPNAPITLQVTD